MNQNLVISVNVFCSDKTHVQICFALTQKIRHSFRIYWYTSIHYIATVCTDLSTWNCGEAPLHFGPREQNVLHFGAMLELPPASSHPWNEKIYNVFNSVLCRSGLCLPMTLQGLQTLHQPSSDPTAISRHTVAIIHRIHKSLPFSLCTKTCMNLITTLITPLSSQVSHSNIPPLLLSTPYTSLLALSSLHWFYCSLPIAQYLWHLRDEQSVF